MIDGASTWQRFRYITLPQLRPVLFFVLVIETIGAFQVFDAMYVMTGGGPVRSSYSLVYFLYDSGFKYFDFGYASAIGLVLFADRAHRLARPAPARREGRLMVNVLDRPRAVRPKVETPSTGRRPAARLTLPTLLALTAIVTIVPFAAMVLVAFAPPSGRTFPDALEPDPNFTLRQLHRGAVQFGHPALDGQLAALLAGVRGVSSCCSRRWPGTRSRRSGSPAGRSCSGRSSPR